jgi:uncharacterized protein (TIGR03437 family)
MRILLLFLGAAVVGAAQNTSVAIFTNEAAFSAAIPGTVLIGFGGVLPAGTAFESFNPLIVSGGSFGTSTPGASVNVTDADYYSPNDYPNAFLLGAGSTTSQQTLNITLQKPSLAVAVDYGQLFGGGTGSITLSNGFTYIPTTLPTVGNTAFVGFVSTTPITGLSYTVSGGDWVIEDLRFIPSPNLSIVITHAGDFEPGQNGASYALTVSNAGLAPTSGTITVADSLPPMITPTNISGMGWTCIPGTLTCSRADALAPLAGYPPINIPVDVGSGVAGGITDTASVSGGGSANANGSDFTTTFTQSQVNEVWASINSPLINDPDALLLLTDGSVIVHQFCSGTWARLVPDNFGNYANGAWSALSPMPRGYAPFAFSSAVLADGRVVVIGGEYNNPPCSPAAETNLGAIYDPKSDTWQTLPAPEGWANVGDAPNTVLPNGHFLLGNALTSQIASLDPSTLAWTSLKGTGKADANSEEGWTLLPDGSVLTVDVGNAPQSERYLPSTDMWEPAGNTVAPLIAGFEVGPQVLRPNGTVFVGGATGHTAIYNVPSNTWSAGPDFPVSNGKQLVEADAPGALLPSGNVLLAASPFDSQQQKWSPPTLFFEFDGMHLNAVPATPTAAKVDTSAQRVLVLPSGQILFADYLSSIDIYTPAGSPDPAWAPTITAAPSLIQAGATYAISGTQFNGLSQAVGFGDDFQAATNYPLVRITNSASGHVFYCRTHGHSTMAVATSNTEVSTNFDVPASVESGPSNLVVVANGIASNPWKLTVSGGQTPTGPSIARVEGGALSTPAVTTVSQNGYFTIFGTNFAAAGISGQLESSDIVDGALPTNLASTCVNVDATPAYLSYVSSSQINAITPSFSAGNSVAITVIANCGASNQITSPAVNSATAAASPEFLYWVQNTNGQNPVIAVDAIHGDHIGPPGLIPGLTFRLARVGDVLTIYGIGFGPTDHGPVPGLIPSLADTVSAGGSLSIGGITASPSYVGVTPGSAGLYQVNVTIPAGIVPGNQSMILNVNGSSTPATGFLATGP